jgi:hypothetical protein
MSAVPPPQAPEPTRRRRRPWLILATIVVAAGLAYAALLTVIAGWGFWLPPDAKQRIAQDALSRACETIVNVQIDECSFTVHGSFLSPTISVKLTAATDDPRAAADAVIAGQKAALAGAHAVTEQSAMIYVAVTTPNMTVYTAQSVGFTSKDPSQSTLEERYR